MRNHRALLYHLKSTSTHPVNSALMRDVSSILKSSGVLSGLLVC